ncbi:MAG: hypothetical protein JWO87_3811 [Phycisphaerales bacterium]|nr:hypothetical protein [Phycisphaerales bacterium]MDB5303149.1 hypothetical protein [Phycisphaerales bacterium]
MAGVCATLNVKVVPGAKRDRVVGRYGDGVKVQVSAPPEDGKANRAVVQVLAEALDVKASQVEISRGHSQARKVVSVQGLDQMTLDAWRAALPE